MKKIFIFCFLVLAPLVGYGDENIQAKEPNNLSKFLIDIGEGNDAASESDDVLTLGGNRRAVPGIQVYDSDYNYLGVLINMGTNQTGHCIYNDNFKSFFKIGSAGNIIDWVDPYFENLDCSGIPYIIDREMYFISRSSQETYYTGKRVASIPDFKPKSYIDIYGTCKAYNENNRTLSVVPAIEVPSSELVNFRPVKVPFRYKGKMTVIVK